MAIWELGRGETRGVRDNVGMPSLHFACVLSASCAALLGACVVDDEPIESVDPTAAERRSCDDDPLVQPGTNLVLLGVTADDHAIYQDGSTVYATELDAGATPITIGEVSAGNVAFVYVAGRVAFVWTDPDYSLPGFGVSPLVIYTAAEGAHAASAASPIGTLVTAASSDGRQIVFPDNTDAAGSVADLVLASSDLSDRTVLIAGAAAAFPSGACRPEAVFLGHGHRAYPAIAACTGGATRATLSTWRNGIRADVDNLRAPPRITVDPDRARIGTLRHNAAGIQEPVVITPATGTITVLDPGVAAGRAMFGGDGAALWLDTTTAVHRARLPWLASAQVVVPSLAVLYGLGAGSEALLAPPTTNDGRALLYATTVDPATGLTDLALADLRAGTSSVIDPSPTSFVLTGTPFTQDSRYVVTNTVTDLTTFEGPLVATKIRDLTQHDLSDDRPGNWLFGAGDRVVVGDNFAFGATSAGNTVDLSVVDLGSHHVREIATGASPTFFLADDGRAVVYTIADQGLLVDR